MHAKIRRFFGLFIIIFSIQPQYINSQTRYQSEIFSTYDLQSNLTYGTYSSSKLDIYTGTGDHATNRPLVIFIHGGGFKGGDKVSNFGTLVCGGLAKRGYVVASINYRITSSIPDNPTHFEAMIRALQDAKAAVRYFRKNASTHGVDGSQIFATGSSAGSITALHLAYLDSIEVPSYVTWGNVGGTFEGTSGNPGYSSQIQGVISNWGAIGDTTWMSAGNVPVYCVHGTEDATVFYDQIPADGPFLYGSKFIYERAQLLGLTSGLRLFYNTGHTLDNNSTKQDSAYKDFSAWLYSILNFSIGQPYKLKFGVQPSNTLSGNIIVPAVTVQVEDSLGNLMTSDNRNVTILFGNNTGPGNLSGTLTKSATSGVATFSDLSIDVPGSGYTFMATASSIIGDTSDVFNILPSGATNTITTSGSGNWSSTTPNAPWPGGVIPTFSDNVIIADGHTVSINTNANCASLKVGQGGSGVLEFEQITPRTLTVTNDVIIFNGGAFRSNLLGSVTTHSLSLGGNLINNGTLDFSTNSNTAGATITFTGSSNTTFSGTGSTTDIRSLTIIKGASHSSILELNPINFTVQGSNSDGTHMAFLTLTNGTLKISGSFTMSARVFISATFTIPKTGGIWLNNPNFTVVGQNGNSTCDGLLHVSSGVFNIGSASSNRMSPTAGTTPPPTFIFDGGTTNIAGMLRAGSSTNIFLEIRGGTINVTTVGNTGSGEPGFGFTSTSNTINILGGTINLVQRNRNSTAGNRRDYNVLGGTINITGGILNVGTISTTTNFDFAIGGNTPNLVIDNISNTKIARLSGSVTVFGDLSINSGSSLELNGRELIMKGNSTDIGDIGDILNNGSIDGSVAGSILQFGSDYGQETYSGAGTLNVRSINVNNTNGIKLNSGNWNIIDALTLTNGNLTLGPNNLIGSSIAGGTSSSFIVTDGIGALTIKNVGASNILFPIGFTPSSYTPVILNNTGTLDDFSVKVKNIFDNPLTDTNAVVKKQWIVSEGTPGGSNATITLQWNANDEHPNFVRGNALHISRWNGSNWVQTSATISGSGPYTASASGFTSFSPFIVECDNPLPVELSSFTAEVGKTNVTLRWKTETETKNYGWEIERKKITMKNSNSSGWEKLGFVSGAGNSNSPKEYSFIDKSALYGEFFYRLKQIDADGSITFSQTIEVTVGIKPIAYSINNFPNPFNPETQIRFEVPQAGKIIINIYDILGNKISTLLDEYLEEGIYQRKFDGREATSGIYFYQLKTDNVCIIKKMLLLK